ncbi:MAG: type IIL restriction-modification enzyme MmeI [Thermoguttaceae bacterium]
MKQNAVNFASEWHGDKCERAEFQSFWNDFFAVFGVRRRSVASFEERVKQVCCSRIAATLPNPVGIQYR